MCLTVKFYLLILLDDLISSAKLICNSFSVLDNMINKLNVMSKHLLIDIQELSEDNEVRR